MREQTGGGVALSRLESVPFCCAGYDGTLRVEVRIQVRVGDSNSPGPDAEAALAPARQPLGPYSKEFLEFFETFVFLEFQSVENTNV